MLSHAIENINDSVFITNMEGKIVYVNKAFCKNYGYKRKEIIDKSSNVIWKGKPEKNKGNNFLLDTIKGRRVDEICHVRKDGSALPVSLSTSIIRDNNKNEVAIIGVARDVTERRQAEQERELMQSQLLQAQKMEAIGILAGGIAHDFNNILTTIQGFASIIFMSSLAGYLISPIHLCNVLSSEYLKTDTTRMYRSFVPAVLLMLVIQILIISAVVLFADFTI